MRKKILFVLMLFLLRFSPVYSQVPEESGTEKNEEPVRYKLTVNYRFEDEEKPFSRTVYLNEPGYSYNIAFPEVEGYKTDTDRLTGVFPDNEVVEIVYRLQNYSVSVHYRYLDGSTAAMDYSTRMDYGSSYYILVPDISGYTAVIGQLEGVVPGRDVEQTVFFVPEDAVFAY